MGKIRYGTDDVCKYDEKKAGREEKKRKEKENFFFFNDTATTEIYTLSLHDALPISMACGVGANYMTEILNGPIVLPAMNTLFMGTNLEQGKWSERCAACGD